MVSARKRIATPAQNVITDDVFARVIAGVKAMTPSERRQSLIDAGIITAKGNYTKPYRILGTKAAAR